MVCNHSGKVGMKDPQRVSNLRKFKDNYDWSGLEFPVSINDIGKFDTRNDISVNILAVEGRDNKKRSHTQLDSRKQVMKMFIFTGKAREWVEKLIC